MNMHHHEPNVVFGKDVAIGLNLTGIQSLEVPGPGAVAHMSLHRKLTMSKSHSTKQADSNGAPIFTGVRLSDYVGDRSGRSQ